MTAQGYALGRLDDLLRVPLPGVVAGEVPHRLPVSQLRGRRFALPDDRYSIGESTVKTCLLRVFGTLGVDGRAAAVASARRFGLLER